MRNHSSGLKPKYMVLLLIYMAFSGTVSALTHGQESQAVEKAGLPLTLDECIQLALKNNLSLIVEKYGPEIAEASVYRAQETFLPRLDLNYGNQRQESPPYWWIQGETTVVTKYQDYGFTLTQQIPTGGSLSLSLASYRSDTTQAFQLINPRYGSTLRLDITQPLLRNFGPRMSRREIILAEKSLAAAEKQYENAVVETVYLVQEAYWNLVYAIENLQVKQYSLQLARDLLRKNQKEVEVGKLAAIELLNAEAEVASREAEIIQAEGVAARAEQVLRNIINLDSQPEKSRLKIVPVDKPKFQPREVSLDQAVKAALELRPDVEQLRKTIEAKQFSVAVAKNQLLPSVDLQFSYWSPGISGDRLLYLNDNPFLGIVVGREKGSALDSLRDALKLIYQNWYIGLNFSFPLNSLTTRAGYAVAKLELEQTVARLKSLEQQVRLEVSDTVREIETSAKRVEALRVARERAEKRLAAEEKKMAVGLTTNYFVLQYQTEVANARSQELQALISYNLSLAKLDKITGKTLSQYQGVPVRD